MNTAHNDQLHNLQGSSGMKLPDRAQAEHREVQPEGSALSRPVKTALLMAALVGGFYLLREHWDHVAGNWIYLLLLACPLMHLFHGHGGHGGQAKSPTKPVDKEK